MPSAEAEVKQEAVGAEQKVIQSVQRIIDQYMENMEKYLQSLGIELGPRQILWRPIENLEDAQQKLAAHAQL